MLEIVFFFTIVNALPLFSYVKKQCNEIYMLFATLPVKDIALMLENYKRLGETGEILSKLDSKRDNQNSDIKSEKRF